MMRTLLLFFLITNYSCARRTTNLDTGLPGVRTEAVAYRPRLAPIGLALASGAAYGVHETVVHHPDRIPASWDRQYWDARVSWTNKYAGGNPAGGEKFPGSTTALAWLTDAKHLFGSTHRVTLFAAGVTVALGDRRPAWHYLADAGLSFAAFSIGFHGVYSLAFRP